MSKPDLSPKQQVFVDAYLQTWNATEAARVAMYAHPNKQGPRLLARSDVSASIHARLVSLADETNGAVKQLVDHFQTKTAAKNHQGYVYFIQADNGAVKIGKTADIAKRLSTLNALIPCDLELILLIPSDNCHHLEKTFHNRFANKRFKGEWFQLSTPDIDAAKQMVDKD